MASGQLHLFGNGRGEGDTLDHRAVLTDLRNYLAGSFTGATRDEALLEEVAKCLFCRMFIEKGNAPEPDEDAAPAELARFYRGVFSTVRTAHPDVFERGEELLLDPAGLSRVMGRLKEISVFDSGRDALGDAYELFTESHLRQRSGQFFTPRNATRFLVEIAAPTKDETVIDPACGAGGFLSTTLQYLIADGQSREAVTGFAGSGLFGVDKDAYLARLARIHVGLLSDTPANVACADSLAWRLKTPADLKDFPALGEYDVVLTNPPFGSRIVSAEGDVLQSFDLARRWRRDRDTTEYTTTSVFQKQVPPQVLFLELCIDLLRPGGRLGIVVPESMISSQRYGYVVQYVRDRCHIEVVAGMPEALFKTSGRGGTHTKTALLLLTRKKRDGAIRSRDRIFMAEAKWCGHDSRGRPIPYDDLPKIVSAFRSRKGDSHDDGAPLDSVSAFEIKQDEVRDGLLAPRQYDPSIPRQLEALSDTHLAIRFGELMEDGIVRVATGHEVGKLAYGTGSIPFIRTSDISNWEIKLDPKHSVSEEVYDKFASKQDVRPGDILMVRDGTYLIGTCALVTEDSLPILYQSHLYKIRVEPNDLGLGPHLLLALLSSPVVQAQIRAKRVTQDIIDSLGNRIRDLVLPMPRSDSDQARLRTAVEDAIGSRLRARQRTRDALRLVSFDQELGDAH